MSNAYEITVVISTYNRSEMLRVALEHLLDQESGRISYEVIVVDNNSCDDTREVIGEIICAGHPNLRYVFEPKQGSSFARNAGIAEATADIIAFVDDDVFVERDWIATIKRAFENHHEIDCIGGRVVPVWSAPIPKWLNSDHWMPLALQDYGHNQLTIDLHNTLCLVSANIAFRRGALLDVGMFKPELQRVKDGVGSMEDAELLERLWQSGRKCRYIPDLIVHAVVPTERLNKMYHRRWHRGHGYFYAIKREKGIDSGSLRFLDVPAHLYKRAVINFACWLLFLMGNPAKAFVYETGLHFFYGFFCKRREDYLLTAYRGPLHELSGFLRALFTRKEKSNSSLIQGTALSERPGARQ